MAIWVLLEVDRKTIEDGAWMRKKDDTRHINLMEL